MTDATRRGFISGLVLLGTSAVAANAAAQQRSENYHLPVDELGPFAAAMGYRADAGRVDKNRFKDVPSHQRCLSCANFRSKGKDSSGLCVMFQQQASPSGWCSAWSKANISK